MSDLISSVTNVNGKIVSQEEVIKDQYAFNDGARGVGRLKPLGAMRRAGDNIPTPEAKTTQISSESTTAAQLAETIRAKRLKDVARRDLRKRNIPQN